MKTLLVDQHGQPLLVRHEDEFFACANGIDEQTHGEPALPRHKSWAHSQPIFSVADVGDLDAVVAAAGLKPKGLIETEQLSVLHQAPVLILPVRARLRAEDAEARALEVEKREVLRKLQNPSVARDIAIEQDMRVMLDGLRSRPVL